MTASIPAVPALLCSALPVPYNPPLPLSLSLPPLPSPLSLLPSKATSLISTEPPLSQLGRSIQRALALSGPRTRPRLGHKRVPVAAIRSAVVHLEHVSRVNREARYDAGGLVAAEQALVQTVARLVAWGEALLNGAVSDYGQDPGADLLSVVLWWGEWGSEWGSGVNGGVWGE